MTTKRIFSLLLLSAGIIFYSGCSADSQSDTDKGNTTETEVNEANIFALDLDVEGMVCRQGCAKTIEKKIGEMDGVISCTVDYDNKKASISFDQTKLDNQKIISTISTMHDGQYKVSTIKTEEPEEKEEKEEENEPNSKTAYNSSGNSSGDKFVVTEIITYFMNGF